MVWILELYERGYWSGNMKRDDCVRSSLDVLGHLEIVLSSRNEHATEIDRSYL